MRGVYKIFINMEWIYDLLSTSFSSPYQFFKLVSDNVCPGVVRAAFRYANAKQQVEYPGT
jgi:hypothetical protein